MRIQILNCPIDVLTVEETLTLIKDTIDNKSQIHHVVVNAAKLIKMKKNKELFNSVVSADIINADGNSVVWLSKILGMPLPERVTGIDLMQSIIEKAKQFKWRIFFFGARQEIVEKVVDRTLTTYGKDIVAGFRNGYYGIDEEEEIARSIANSEVNILFVAITSPKKEMFLYKYKELLKDVNLIMGVGGSFDVLAGSVKRAPVWMQKLGFEWFFRVIQEPRRMWKRYLVTNTLFIYYAIKEIMQKRILKKNNYFD